MKWECFLAAWDNGSLRHELWPAFQEAEAEAKAAFHCLQWGAWHQPVQVIETDPGQSASYDYSTKTMRIPRCPNERGAMFHEIFHLGSYCAPARSHTCEDTWSGWEEAFCNAFRYFMELCYFDGTEWSQQVDARMEEDNAGPPNADPILRACSKDYERFKQFWSDLNRSGQAVDVFVQSREE